MDERAADGLTIDPGLCVKCERCRRVCPTGAADQAFHLARGAAPVCIRCGHCMAVCPTKAFQAGGLRYEEMPPTGARPAVSRADLTAYIKERRSIRRFTDALLPDEAIGALLDLAQCSASGHNQHRGRWGVVKGKARIRALADAVIDAVKEDAHCADLVQAYRGGKNALTRDASHLIFIYMPAGALIPVEDGTVAMELLELVLPAFGLGGCWGGYMTMLAAGSARVRELLQVPPRHRLVGTMLLGYPAQEETYLRIPPHPRAEIHFFGG